MPEVAAIMTDVGAVALYITVFAADFGALPVGGGVVVVTKVAAKFFAVVCDLGFVTANIALVVADVARVATNVAVAVTPAFLGSHRSNAHDADEENAPDTFHVFPSLFDHINPGCIQKLVKNT